MFWVAFSDGDDANPRVRKMVPGEQGDSKLQPVDVINQIFGLEVLVYMLAHSIGSASVIVGYVENHCPVEVPDAVAVVSQ